MQYRKSKVEEFQKVYNINSKIKLYYPKSNKELRDCIIF